MDVYSNLLKVHNHSDITAGSGKLELAGGRDFTVTDSNLTTTIFPNAAVKSEPADIVLNSTNGIGDITLVNSNIYTLGNLNATASTGSIDIKDGTTRIGKKLITKSSRVKTKDFRPTAIDPNKKLDSIAMNATNDILFIDSNLDTINETAITTLGSRNYNTIKTIGSSITSEKGLVDIGTTTLIAEKTTIGGDTTKIKSIEGSRYSDSIITSDKSLTIDNTKGAMYSDHTTMKTNGVLTSTAETIHISNDSDFSGKDGTKLIATGRKKPLNPKVTDPNTPSNPNPDERGPGGAITTYGPGNPFYDQNNDPDYFGPTSEQNTGNVVVEGSKVTSPKGPVEVIAEKGTTDITNSEIAADGGKTIVTGQKDTTITDSDISGNGVDVTSKDGNTKTTGSTVDGHKGDAQVISENGTTDVDGTTIRGQNALVHGKVGTIVNQSILEGNSKVQVTSEGKGHTSIKNTNIVANKLINLFGKNLTVIKNNLVVDPDTLKLSADNKLTALLNNGHFTTLIIESLNDPNSVVNRTNSWNPPVVNVNVNFDYGYEDHFTQHRIVARDDAQDLSYQEIISGNNHVVVQDVNPIRHQTVYDVNKESINKAYATTASSHPMDTHATSYLSHTSTATQVTPESGHHQPAKIIHTTALATCYQDILNLARTYHLTIEQITDPNVIDKYPQLKQALVRMDDCYNDFLAPQNFDFEREKVVTTVIPQ